MAPFARAAGLNLIFDADDTLWDSNIYFLEAEAAAVELLARFEVEDRSRVRASIRRHELKIIESHGYGRRPYILALNRVVLELASPAHHEPLLGELREIGERLLNRPCKPLPGVEQTLGELGKRHRLLLFTKGRPDEQMRKLEQSGLRRFFSGVGIPVEKDAVAYRLLIAQAELEPSRTVMIGNSPRSDINPALKAGLRAVYIPHPDTWELEHEMLDHADGRLMTIAAFPDLLEIF